ncbi:MAG: hypothetical protein LBK82_00885 [Planctomycetaceae bacterium]|nr:hypothetical protein [Planctomycetaceae bacterium]
MIPKRKATRFAVVNLIHCRRKWVGDLSLKGRVGDSRLVPYFRLAIRFPNGRQHNWLLLI